MNIPIAKNTLTNYGMIALRLCQSILITRWLITYMGTSGYGLWMLLWTFFSYTLFLDFGFGMTVQKYTSAGLPEDNPDRYNSVMSTVFSFYALMSVIIILCTVAASFFTAELFRLQNYIPEVTTFCRRCLLLFGIGTALLFPTGIFTEILVGAQHLYVRNTIVCVFKIIEFTGIFLILYLCREVFHIAAWYRMLYFMILFVMSVTLCSNWTMFLYAKKLIPTLRLRLKIERDVFRSIFHFSGAVYLTAVANLIWKRSGSFLMGIFCGLTPVGVFQLGDRLPDMIRQASSSYQESFGPVAARLYARNRRRVLTSILIKGMRWNAFVSIGLPLGVIILSRELLSFLFNSQELPAVNACRIICLEVLVTQAFRSLPGRFLLMTGRHKLISVTTAAEALLAVTLFLILLPVFPTYGMLIVPAVIFGIRLCTTGFVILPAVIAYTGQNYAAFLTRVAGRQIFAAIPMVLTVKAVKDLLVRHGFYDFFVLAGAGLTGGIVYLTATYLIAASRNERAMFLKRMITALPGFCRKVKI